MITAGQTRAVRALLGIERLAERSGLSSSAIQRIGASDAVIRGSVDSLRKLGRTLAASGAELDNAPAPPAVAACY